MTTSNLTDLMETILKEEYEACGDDRDDLINFFSKFCTDETTPDLLENPNWCERKMRGEIDENMDLFGASNLPQQFRNAIKYDIDEMYLLTVVIDWHEVWYAELHEDDDDAESLPDDPEDKTVGYLMPDGRLIEIETN